MYNYNVESFIEENFFKFWLICMIWALVAVPTFVFFTVKRYLPIRLKDVFNGEKIKPEKAFSAAGKLGWCAFRGHFFTMGFYADFLTVSYLGRCIIAKYSEKIEIGRNFLGTNFIKFPDINPKIVFYFYSKNDAEYTKERFGNCAEKDNN